MGVIIEEVCPKYHVSSMWCLTIQPSDTVARWDAINRHRYFMAVVCKSGTGLYLHRLNVVGSKSELYYLLASMDFAPDVSIIALGTVWHDRGEPSLTVRAEDCDTLNQKACDVIHGLAPDMREAYGEMIDELMVSEDEDQGTIPFTGNN